MPKLPSCLMICLLLVGCGDDDVPAIDGGNPADQCVSASDQTILGPYLVDAGTGLSDALNTLLRTCAQDSCAAQVVSGTELEAEECMRTCYATTGIAGLSPGCEDCWTGSVICGADYCSVECLGTDPDLCTACIVENCNAQRVYCTGL